MAAKSPRNAFEWSAAERESVRATVGQTFGRTKSPNLC